MRIPEGGYERVLYSQISLLLGSDAFRTGVEVFVVEVRPRGIRTRDF